MSFPESQYGYCPRCLAPGERRQRRPNGNDQCSQGHVYPSASAITREERDVDLIPRIKAIAEEQGLDVVTMELEFSNLKQRAMARQDAAELGTGWLRFNADGTQERIDPERVTVAEDE